MNDAYHELRIIGIRDETADTRSFMLESRKGEEIRYRAGQFLTLIFPKKDSETRRSYSISSTPLSREPLTITVKRVVNGEVSRYLFDQGRVGDSLFTIGASGFFVLPPDPEQFAHYVFYAAGSGITPVFPLIKTIIAGYKKISVYLTYSNHSSVSTIFLEELKQLVAQFPENLTVEWLFSDAKNLLRARLTKSLVESQVHDRKRFDKDKSLFFLCGPHEYMQMISITLLREGITNDRIRKEIFETIKPIVKDRPPDTDIHQVTILLGDQRHTFQVRYPDTILETAKRNGLVLPYSCEAGKCGTCSATCKEGKVWMWNNEVLLDSELKEGRVLTCTGYPVGGDVVLDYSE